MLSYAKNGLLITFQPSRLQVALDVLVGILIGLYCTTTSTRRWGGSASHSTWLTGTQMRLNRDRLRVGGGGATFREHQCEGVKCLECAEDFLEGLMTVHLQTQYGTGQGPQWEKTPPSPDPSIYRVYFPRASGSVGCLVEGYRGRATTCTNLRIHFVKHHMRVHDSDSGGR